MGEGEKKDVYFNIKKGKCLKELMNLPNLKEKKYGGEKKSMDNLKLNQISIPIIKRILNLFWLTCF